jgi:tRNA pseudouridine38-40 synthase
MKSAYLCKLMQFWRYFIRLSYNGTEFCGWQQQPGVATIQETLDEKLSMLIREKVHCIGCGRTDTGVHAREFYAHFDSTQEGLDRDEKYIFRLNMILPYGIAVQRIFAMKENAHARFGAISRSYEYHISDIKNPFATQLFWRLHERLDMSRMNEAAKLIPLYDDFAAFAKTGGNSKTTICKVSRCEWVKDSERIVLHITANRFLRNMVRAIVGTLTEVGRGKLEVEDVRRIIESKKRTEAGPSVPAQGLFLTRIIYPDDYGLN